MLRVGGGAGIDRYSKACRWEFDKDTCANRQMLIGTQIYDKKLNYAAFLQFVHFRIVESLLAALSLSCACRQVKEGEEGMGGRSRSVALVGENAMHAGGGRKTCTVVVVGIGGQTKEGGKFPPISSRGESSSIGVGGMR